MKQRNTKKSQEEIQQKIWNRFPNIQILSDYIGANNKVVLKCTNCGYQWETTARSVAQSKHGCPQCGVEKSFREKSIQNFKEKLKKTDFEYIDYVGKINNIHIVKVRCKTCGYIRTTNMNNVLRFGCNKCAQKRMPQCIPKTTEEFIKKAREIHGNKYDYSKVNYIQNKEKVCIICPEHGEFWQTPNKHLYCQRGCPTCSGSSLEKIANTTLLENKIKFEKEVFINYNGRRMFVDFVIDFNNHKYFLELNGEQHYKEVLHWHSDGKGLIEQQQRDALLQEYCNSNNIPLYWIKFDELIKNKIEEILKEIAAVYTSDCIDDNSAKTVNPEMGIPC